MSKTVLSLTAKHGEPRYLQAIQGNYWFWQRGYHVVEFTRDQLAVGELDAKLLDDAENTIVFASVAVIRDALLQAGRPAPPSIDFPAALLPFVGRVIDEATMGDVQNWVQAQSDRLPVHVKPRDRQKLFSGKVVSTYRDLIAFSGVPADEPVIVQEVMDLASEWRVSILRKQVLNVAHYKGDPLIFPSSDLIREAIDLFVDAPIGYAMDWAVTAEGKPILVEVNDGYALGNYGVRGHHYTAMIECRWRQLMGLEDNGVGTEW